MKTVKINVYPFAELSDEAKERAHSKWLECGHEYSWAGEVRDTIKAFEDAFGVKITRWQYSSWSYDYSLDFDGIDADVLELSGNRARAWFWNNHGDLLLTGRYYGKKCREHSRFFFDRVYDGTCPLTGVCYDCAALDPLAYFCFGTEWDEGQKKRVQSSRRTLAADNANTVESILRDCVESLFESVEKDCEYEESMEAFAETCEANGYTFTEDGEMWNEAREVA